MPATWPNEQDRDLVVEPVFFPLRTGESDRAPDRVPQIDLALDHVGPGRRVRVLEIGHEHFRAGIERVDHHLAIGRSGDLHPPIAEIRRNRRACPIAFADLLRLRQKIERLAAIERRLPLLTTGQTFQRRAPNFALQLRHESERIRRQNFGERGCDFALDRDTVRSRDGITIRHRQFNSTSFTGTRFGVDGEHLLEP